MTNGNGDLVTNRYRMILPVNPDQALGALGGMYRIPAHPQTSLALKWVSLFHMDGTVYTFPATDIISALIYVARSGVNQAPQVGGQMPDIPLASFSWAPAQKAGADVLNPAGLPGLIFPDPLTLSPNDDPCWFFFYDQNQSTGVTQAQWNRTLLIVHGWEIGSGPGSTFPTPDSFDSVI